MTAGAHNDPVDRLLPRLDVVRELGRDRWLARCPAHNDHSPSLSIRTTQEGPVLLKCFAGCSAADVVNAAGLTLADLFPDRMEERRPMRQRRCRVPVVDALAAVDREALTVAVIASDVREHRELDDTTWRRLATAVARIGQAREAVQ